MKKLIVFGATSGIARAFCKSVASDVEEIVLVGRNEESLNIMIADIQCRGCRASKIIGSMSSVEDVAAVTDAIKSNHSDFDTLFLAHGVLPDQEKCESDTKMALDTIQVNFLSLLHVTNDLVPLLEERKDGTVVVISSVAGDRGRKSNYVYGCAKGGLSIYLQGLRNRLASKGVHVLTVKPGFVDTPMTAHLEKGPLFASPEVVANGIVKAIEKKYNEVYLPWFWWGIMSVIKNIPEFIFKKLSL